MEPMHQLEAAILAAGIGFGLTLAAMLSWLLWVLLTLRIAQRFVQGYTA